MEPTAQEGEREDDENATLVPWAVAAHGQTSTLEGLAERGVPKPLLRIIYLLIQHRFLQVLFSSGIHAVEFFAGQQRICKAIRRLALIAVPFDNRTVDREMDLCTDGGFAIALVNARNTYVFSFCALSSTTPSCLTPPALTLRMFIQPLLINNNTYCCLICLCLLSASSR